MSISGGIPATIAIDLTPVLPGGRNGGLKIIALELVTLLARIATCSRFLLLTTRANHDELSVLDTSNVQRFCIDQTSAGRSALDNLALHIRSGLSSVLPGSVVGRMASSYRVLRKAQRSPSLLQQLNVDVLFCPFLDPYYDDGTTPFVSIIPDLQFLEIPEFFPESERQRFRRAFEHVARRAARIICISQYVRETVSRAGAPSNRCLVIYPALQERFDGVGAGVACEAVLSEWGLAPSRYLLYPANFWRHKNHASLIQALDRLVRQWPDFHLKLVLTGTGGTEHTRIIDQIRGAGLSSRVVLPGFVSDAQLYALLRCSLALIFPSLYEGFGMPVVEAMAAGIPALCSDVTSLPEIAGGAALLFDPRSPLAISDAIAQIARDRELRTRLVESGRRRIAAFGSATQMAGKYWQTLCEAAQNASRAVPPMIR